MSGVDVIGGIGAVVGIINRAAQLWQEAWRNGSAQLFKQSMMSSTPKKLLRFHQVGSEWTDLPKHVPVLAELLMPLGRRSMPQSHARAHRTT